MLGRQTVNITDSGNFHRNDHGLQHVTVIEHTESAKAKASLERVKEDLDRLNARVTKEMKETFTGQGKDRRRRRRKSRGRRRVDYDTESDEGDYSISRTDSEEDSDDDNYYDSSSSTEDDSDGDVRDDDSDDSY